MPWALQTFYREVTLVRQLSCLFHWLRPERNLYILEWVSQKGDMESDPKSDQEKYLWECNLRLGKGQSASVLLTRFFYLVIDDKVFLFKVINDSCKQVHFLKEQILGLWGFPGGLVVKTLFFPRRHGWIPHQGIRSHTSQSIAKKKKKIRNFIVKCPPSSLPEAAGSCDDSFIICQEAGIGPLRFYMPFGRTGVLCSVLKMWPASKSVLPWEKWKSFSKKMFSLLCPETAELRTVSTTWAVTEIPISVSPETQSTADRMSQFSSCINRIAQDRLKNGSSTGLITLLLKR